MGKAKKAPIIEVIDDDEDTGDDVQLIESKKRTLLEVSTDVNAVPDLLPPPQYVLELAKSNRSECKRCSTKIDLNELRVGVVNEGEWGLFTKWQHLACTVFHRSVTDPSELSGYEDLSRSQKSALFDRVIESRSLIDPDRQPVDPDELVRAEWSQEAEQPATLLMPLLPYQKEGLAWMLHREASVGGCGILADEMGMGKTIQAISLILENRPLKPPSTPDANSTVTKSKKEKKASNVADTKMDADSRVTEESMAKYNAQRALWEAAEKRHEDRLTSTAGLSRGGTLIVLPTIAIRQWESELARFTAPGYLTVKVYHGADRSSEHSLTDLAAADVVLTSYKILEMEYRKATAGTKVKCRICLRNFYPEKLRVHRKYFCGQSAQRTEAQAKTQKKLLRAGGSAKKLDSDDDDEEDAGSDSGESESSDEIAKQKKKAQKALAKNKSVKTTKSAKVTSKSGKKRAKDEEDEDDEDDEDYEDDESDAGKKTSSKKAAKSVTNKPVKKSRKAVIESDSDSESDDEDDDEESVAGKKVPVKKGAKKSTKSEANKPAKKSRKTAIESDSDSDSDDDDDDDDDDDGDDSEVERDIAEAIQLAAKTQKKTRSLTAEMCRVFRIQEGEEGIGILMRYEAGGALEQIVHSPSKTTLPMTPLEKIRLLLEIAQGIAELHSSGIVHADIKLDNVLLSHHRPPKVRLADFGLSIFKTEEESKLGHSTLMMTSHLRGTPIYCAPELLTNPFEPTTGQTIIAKPSRKTDMYAFAIVAWEILSHNQPFAEIRTEGELCTRVHQGHRPPLSDLPPDVSPAIRAMIESCWSKNRNDRKTAVECVRLLQYEYVSAKKGLFDIYFSHASVPKLLLSHIYYYFVRLGCTVCTGFGFTSQTDEATTPPSPNTPLVFNQDVLNSKLVILCFDKEYQQSARCMRELEEFKRAHPDRQVLTLVVEEKLMAWANERAKEVLRLQSPVDTVDIGHIGRAHWESEEGPDAAMLVALTKNLDPLRELVIKSDCITSSRLVEEARLGSMKSAVISAKSKSRTETTRILAGLELCVAVYEGDLTYLRGLLESGCPVNACDYDFRTAAHICCADNLVQAALILHEFKADFTSDKVRDRWGRTPLEEAENHRHLHLATALRSIIEAEKERHTMAMIEDDESGLVEEKQNCVGLELCVAAFDGDATYLRALLESGCPVGAADYDLRTAAHIACAENNVEIVRILFEFGAEFHSKKVKDRYGNTPLMEAEKHGHTELAQEVKRVLEEKKKSGKKASGK